MKIEISGAVINLDDEDEIDDMLNLRCKCGHAYKEHEHTWGYGTLKTWYASQCVPCGFKNKNTEFVCKVFTHAEANNEN
jgi:hypothetical protein